ncbi:tRNA dihydrouridine(16) synthase DusC [Shewanella eurypsychrophilus]|uniref:tRNA-dihydrouridine(16) synthase n=1 Tax=Shewanella eurypsychrophilus TaxID=2593656 RepID=A0ABX6V4H9_9GAMM|nr:MULTISPECIES: tRNA dihydrouridine(16) synthase DusC [Shewanella]QFU22270.1 tRNA dihydrouridine(16) synthase DusC [Shewanella sp. YLB-09]QPG57556.1 tRNA dihydrouridine(16) synthase DusC [Shewanella eurypsychrophilus]
MRVILAPMEGVADAPMRALLTGVGGYDLVISEFIRVVDQLLPEKVFYRLCAELANESKTLSGTPVRLQLLGQHPQWMAENAIRAIELGSLGVDLNFGCPAPMVNRSNGGAAMLKQPETIYKVVKAVREAVDEKFPVSAKIRLGWDDKSRCVEIAQAIEAAGATELTVHARTKEEGYKPPAHWLYIQKIKSSVAMPVIANGEVWSREDYLKCQQVSQCDDVMIGRGALAVPNLAHVIKGDQAKMPWAKVLQLLLQYSEYEIVSEKEKYYPARIKQWLKFIAKQYSQADELFVQVRVLKKTPDILTLLKAQV